MNRETKSNQHFVWFMITIALVTAILLIGKAVYGANPNSYGECRFDERIHYPKDGLVFDANFLTAQPEGDLTQGLGDMETWVAGCPSGFLCVNLGAGSFTQETAKLYKNNSSGKLTVDGAGSTTSYTYPMSYEANAYYQISFRYKGEAGAETIDCGAHNLALSEFYDFTAHTWGAPSIVFLTATTSWKTANLYMDVGAVAKASYYFSIGRATGINPSQVFYIDDLQIRKLKKGGPYSGPSNVTMTVNGDPSFDSQNAKNSFKGQPGNWGTTFDGVDDYLSCPDATCGSFFYPTHSFTYSCRFVPTTIASGIVFAQDDPGGGTGRTIDTLLDTNNIYSYVLGPSGITEVHTPITAGVMHDFVTTYTAVADGSSILSLYLDNNSVVTKTNVIFPLTDSTASLLIGNRTTNPSYLNGFVYQCEVNNKGFDAIEASKNINPYFPGNNNNRGFYVSTCTQAASHATCSWDTCRDGTPHACQAEETGSMAVFDAKTELIPYNSFETVTGDDSAPTFTGWTQATDPGTGTASITAYRDEVNHGNVAVRLKTSNDFAYTQLISSCIAVSPATNYYYEITAKKLSGIGNFTYSYRGEYTDGACSNLNLYAGSAYQDLTSSKFQTYGKLSATAAGTNSIIIYITQYHSTADILIDSVSLKAGSYRTPWVHNSGAGSTSYNARTYQVHNTLTDATPQGTYPWATGWCISGWVYSDWAGDDGVAHGIFEIPGTAGANNRIALAKNGANEVSFSIFDAAGDRTNMYIGSMSNTKWTSGGWKYFEGCSNNSSQSMMHYYNVANSTWYTAVLVGAPVQDNQTNYVNVGFSAYFNGYLDGYISNICFSPFSASYSGCNWNNGTPPKRPY